MSVALGGAKRRFLRLEHEGTHQIVSPDWNKREA